MARSKKIIVAENPGTAEIKELHVCYIGESLIKHGLTTSNTFRGELPAHITRLIIEYPFIRHLMIDIEELQTARTRLKIVGSLEHQSNLRLREIK